MCVNSILSIKNGEGFRIGRILFNISHDQYQIYGIWVLRDVDFKNPVRVKVRVKVRVRVRVRVCVMLRVRVRVRIRVRVRVRVTSRVRVRVRMCVRGLG